MSNTEIDFDELLNPEERFYKEGVDEGAAENIKHNLLEGRQFGLQVGFQRFVLLGQVLSACDVITSFQLGSSALDRNISTIKKLINDIPLDNNDESVEIYEKNLVKIKNKFRTILITFQKLGKGKLNGQHMNFDMFEDISRAVAGEVKGFVEDEEKTEEHSGQDKFQEW